MDVYVPTVFPNHPREAIDILMVGDAAGRLKSQIEDKKQDFADSDLCFALNCGAAFQVPPSSLPPSSSA